MKPKACTEGPRHKWEFKRNKTVRRQSAHSISFSEVGIYRCVCGEIKYGAALYEPATQRAGREG
jgi:hypothetical protein